MLVDVAVTGICGSDIHIAVEGFIPTGFLPITLGYEIAGTVARTGTAVTGALQPPPPLSIPDRVGIPLFRPHERTTP